MLPYPTSPVNSFLSTRRPTWVYILVGIALTLLPAAMAFLDDSLVNLLVNGTWRPMLTPVAVIYYVWLVRR